MQGELVRVCLIKSANEAEPIYFNALTDLFKQDQTGLYKLVDNIESAAVILMTDIAVWGVDNWWQLSTVHRHPLVKAGCDRLFIYSELDSPYCAYQGLYCSMPKRFFNADRQRAVAYCLFRNSELVTACSKAVNEGFRNSPKLLFSFVGARTTPVREEIFALSHTNCLIQDTTGYNIYDSGQGDFQRQKHYVDTVLDSKFILCPRGLGTGSIRLFESLALGRVPVVVSDQYVFPAGPDWRTCSVRVRERDIGRIPAILSELEPKWTQMASAARQVFDEWYSTRILFHRMIEACLDIRSKKCLSEKIWTKLPDPQKLAFRLRRSAAAVKSRLRSHVSAKS